MSGITRRVALVDRSKDRWDWHDVALVTTGLGMMMEPRIAFERGSIDVDRNNFDPEDEMSRIDEVREVNRHKIGNIFGGNEEKALHGYICTPRLRY